MLVTPNDIETKIGSALAMSKIISIRALHTDTNIADMKLDAPLRVRGWPVFTGFAIANDY